ncbi:hypothetical protein KPH14_013054 [Odynerus spinipes]|uniref:Uncharacterized protein n=1 Tax=Odynerus spinipes TaxID=1348599 RepID=A0AAD9R882_9HYME|nr:hypothetical protein KPH14_013054 [Odynerus spinipes]
MEVVRATVPPPVNEFHEQLPSSPRDVIAIHGVAESSRVTKQEISSSINSNGTVATTFTTSASGASKNDKDDIASSGSASGNEQQPLLKTENKGDYDRLFSSDVFLRATTNRATNIDETGEADRNERDDEDDDDDYDEDDEDDEDNDNDIVGENIGHERKANNLNSNNSSSNNSSFKTIAQRNADIDAKTELDDDESYDVRLKRLAAQQRKKNDRTNGEQNYRRDSRSGNNVDDKEDDEDAVADEDYEEWI